MLNEGATGLENSANGTGRSSSTSGTRARRSPSRNDDYWGEPASIAEITFQYFTDPNAAANAPPRRRHRPPRRIDTDLVEQFEDNPDFVITDGPTNGEFTLGMNNADEVLSDQRVRQAITQAIDKQGLIDLYRGYGTLIGAPVPPFEPWYEDLSGVYPYDPDAARALLEEAGTPTGWSCRSSRRTSTPPTPSTTSCRSSPTSASRSTSKRSSSRRIGQVFVNHDYDLTVVLHVEPRDIGNYANPEYYWLYDSPRCRNCSPGQGVARSRRVRRTAPPGSQLIAEEAPACGCCCTTT